jgi:hypothetical protein
LLLEAYQLKVNLVVFWRLDRFSREGALATLELLWTATGVYFTRHFFASQFKKCDKLIYNITQSLLGQK